MKNLSARKLLAKKLSAFLFILITFSFSSSVWALSIAEKTKGMLVQKGYFTTYWHEDAGQLYLEIDKNAGDFIYYTGLPAGLGSNDIGLDRGQVGSSRLVRFEKMGDKVFLRQVNLKFRALSENAKERQAVEDAFASAILGGFKVAAQSDDKYLINFTDFLISDQHGISGRIEWTKQGKFSVDKSRSAVYMPRTKSFPENTEFEAVLTLKSSKPGKYVRDVAPQGNIISLRQHISFVKLPEPGFKMRKFHVNSGYFSMQYADYAVPIEDNINQYYISRHRLEKKDPSAKMSEAVEPIIYYLDPGVPEPIRGALIEGASWWNQAFEAAGYINAFQVKDLPEGADPMDVRYNIINWVHRKTRGWSYGSRVYDPRTGEILKGHVTLGSLRVRQDFLIATALLSPYEGKDADISRLKAMALARIRQLSAHEVGHTIGLAHNFTTSSADRASVMDYPHPLIKIGQDATLNISDAYAVGIGEWDKYAIQYGYGDFDKEADEKMALQAVIDKAFASGLKFISDPDSRSLKDVHAGSHLWDGGDNATDELARLYEVRRIALENFSEKALKPGQPFSSLEEILVPLYYLHRYQLEAAGKTQGGLDYAYDFRPEEDGSGKDAAYSIISPAEQRRTLTVILKALAPEFLTLPERILKLLPPKAYGHALTRESFPRQTGKAFDATTLGEAAANHVMSILLDPARTARIYEYHARDDKQVALADYMDFISDALLKDQKKTGLEGALQRRVGHVYLHHMMLLNQNGKSSAAARETAHLKLVELEKWLRKRAGKSSKDPLYQAYYLYQADRIGKFLSGDLKISAKDLAAMPPGSPI